ncbi:hypothetical protein CSQ96_24470 [Janthinobacterium sp. BJB412]|nr:hypothetical protein CSQ96_24470 [Janthinobacterium sp. BJB412]
MTNSIRPVRLLLWLCCALLAGFFLLSWIGLPALALALRAAGADVGAPAFCFSSDQMMLVLVCALFYLVAGLMREGRRLADENEGFV